MQSASKRRIFTVLMTLFATSFVISIIGPKLGPQSDLLGDTFKIALLVAVCTALISFIAWTVTHRKGDSLLRGAVAGVLTALLIIPLPAAAWTFKTEVFSAYRETGLFSAIYSAVPPTIGAGLYTFVDITKASLIAVVGSLCLGAGITYYVAGQNADSLGADNA